MLNALESQVQPFTLVTPDNETLYSWHIIPPHLYKDYEHILLKSPPDGPAKDVTKTLAFQLLAKDKNARVVVNLHGNAADVGTGYRPKVYQNFLSTSTPSRPVHVIAFDYRGFGKSTGKPTEEGLITDALTVVNYLTSPPLSISPSRIIIAGQSLGTAVASALAERHTFGNPSDLSPVKAKEPFAGIILMAPFTNIPQLLHTYCIMGFIPPILSPLLQYPQLKKYILDRLLDRWDTAARLAALTGIVPNYGNSGNSYELQPFDLTIIHAVNDRDIPWREGRSVWDAATGGPKAAELGTFTHNYTSEDGIIQSTVWERNDGPGKAVKRVRWERVRYGGHNEIGTLNTVAVAVLRLLDKQT
ncbi:putative acylglycerol lipase [Microsporum canis]